MTREQAKEILLLHKAGTVEENDLEMAEALRLAANDPDLGQWLEQQREFHAATKKEFESIEPPAALKARILEGAISAREDSAPTPRSFVRRHRVWAAAAAIIIVIGAANFWISPNQEDAQTLANFRSRMTSFALRTYNMDMVTNNAAAVRHYLANNGAPSDFPLTAGLEKLPVKGGGRLSWQNHPVAMMCFGLTNNQTAFMFVLDERAVEMPITTPQATAGKNLSSVIWTNGGKIYLLAAAERPEVLRSLAGVQ